MCRWSQTFDVWQSLRAGELDDALEMVRPVFPALKLPHSVAYFVTSPWVQVFNRVVEGEYPSSGPHGVAEGEFVIEGVTEVDSKLRKVGYSITPTSVTVTPYIRFLIGPFFWWRILIPL